MRWVLLASEHAPASPTIAASPLARASPFTATLQNSRCRESVTFPIRKFFRSNVECVEGIGAVCAVFEEVFFRFGKFLAAFVFAETVSAAAYAGCLNGEDKVVVILSVEEWHKALLAGKTLVDEKIFLIVPHGIAEIDRLDSPAVAFKLMYDHPTEVLFVNGIV